MANLEKGEYVAGTIDGKEYVLRYSNDALCELEDKLGKGIVAIMADVQSWKDNPVNIQLRVVRALLWAGLHEKQPELDLRAAGELITPMGGVGEVMEAIGEAMVAAWEVPGESKGGRPTRRRRPKNNGAGLSSSSDLSALAARSSHSGD